MFSLLASIFLVSSAHSFFLHLPYYENFSKIKKDVDESPCPHEILKCATPLLYIQTRQFECKNNQVCPSSYKCCPDSCFHHRICKQIETVPLQPDLCPLDTMPCLVPLNFDQTTQFLCHSDAQCPQGYLCCEDSCFWHKVCKKSFTYLDHDDITPFIASLEEDFGKNLVEEEEKGDNEVVPDLSDKGGTTVDITEDYQAVISSTTRNEDSTESTTYYTYTNENGNETVTEKNVGLTENISSDTNDNYNDEYVNGEVVE